MSTSDPRHYDIILSPVITEKATIASEQNKVTFKVAGNATKPQIKEAIEKLFDEQSREFDNAKRKLMVWNIDKMLQEDGARPVIYHGKAGTCWNPAVKGIRMASNSIYNHWRFEDVWLDR